MYRHPVILQKRIQSPAVKRRQIIGKLHERHVAHGFMFAKEYKRIAAYFILGGRQLNHNAQNHGNQEYLHQHHGKHDGCTPFLSGKKQHRGENHMPEHPKQETSLLPFPEAGKNIFHLHGRIAVLPYVMVFEPVIKEQKKKQTDDGQHRNGMDPKRKNTCFLP